MSIRPPATNFGALQRAERLSRQDIDSAGNASSLKDASMNQDITKGPQKEAGEDASSRNEATPAADEISYNSLPVRRPVEERPTEDDLAQAALGGPKGNPALPAAPLTKREQEQNLFTDEPGHVA
jgi:hypothetical protein